jgi:16S rRNA (guanine527-N7)-methyltransferase
MVTSLGMNAPLDPPSPPIQTGDQTSIWPALGWQPDAAQLGALEALQQELRQWNARLNLTRLVEGDDYWIAQVFDSLWPWRSLLNSPAAPLQLVDVGTGGGFPGLVLAIALPQARLTLVDSVGRKAAAVQAMAAALGLDKRVVVRCERAELTGHSRECRGRFDWALARAVAAAPVVAEYLVPLLGPGGQALLYRGQWGAEDQQAMERAVLPLRAELRRVERQELPSGRGVRHAVVVAATGPCPRLYPRPVGVPAKLPLG